MVIGKRSNWGNNRGAPYFTTAPNRRWKWNRYARKAGLKKITLGQYTNFKSASDISQKQFLLLRTLIIKRRTNQFNPKKYHLENQVARARRLLGQSKDFEAYIDAIAKKADGGVGHFSEVRKHQFEVLRRGKDGNALTKTDETPVNSSFIILLRALESVVPDCKYWWRSSKFRFSVTFSKEGVKRGYTAITDGQLQDLQSHEIKALIECKLEERDPHKPAVDMQEAAQVVAWIKQFPSGERQRISVAQDGIQMYVIISAYTDGWLDYINDGKPTRDFMTMTQYGPYRIDRPQETWKSAEIIVSFLI